MLRKRVNCGYHSGAYIGPLDFLLITETLYESAVRYIFRVNLFLADAAAPGGLRLIKQGEAHMRSDGDLVARRVSDLEQPLRGDVIRLLAESGDGGSKP